MTPRFTAELWPKSSAFTIRYLWADKSHAPKSFSSLANTVSALKYCSAMSLVITLDRFESSQDLVHGVKGEQPLTCGEDRAEAGVLGDDWPASREIARTAITEPSSLQAHVRILSHSKFAARRLQIIPVGAHCERMRVRQTPAV